MSIGKTLGIKVYFEGIEVPDDRISSISVTADSMGVRAAIGVPPLREFRLLRPRTLVHVFFRDDPPGGTGPAEFRLLFEGEVIGFSRSLGSTRNMVLKCQSFSSYWQRTLHWHKSGAAPYLFAEEARRELGVDVTGGGSETTAYDTSKDIGSYINELGVPDGFIRWLTDLSDSNEPGNYPFLVLAEERLRLVQRMVGISDTQVASMYDPGSLKQLMAQIQNTSPKTTPIMAIIAKAMSSIFYAISEQASYRILSGVPQQFVFHPDVWFCPPPKCNVIFPHERSSYTDAREWLAEPTRLRLAIPPGDEGIVGATDPLLNRIRTRVAYAPDELNGILSSSITDDTPNPNPNNVIMDSVDDLDSREDVKGVIPEEISLTNFALWMTSQGGDAGQRSEYMKSVAQFLLAERRLSKRSARVTCSFLPRLACGFPGLVVDDEMSEIGLIESVTHTGSGSAGMVTSVNLRYVRSQDVLWNASGETTLPEWILDSYAPHRVGEPEGPYDTFFGCGSIMEGQATVDAAIAAVESLYRSASSDGPPERTTYAYARRLIATDEEVFRFIGRPYRPDWEAGVRLALTRLRGKGFAG